MWKIKEKVSPHTFRLCDADDEDIIHDFTQSAEHLIRVELPYLDFDGTDKRVIEVFDSATGMWQRYQIEKVGVDGRCLMRKLNRAPGSHMILTKYDADEVSEWFDLSRQVYRWVS